MPATQRQIDANRRNASGPHQMSEVGKAAVRLNAVTHGLTAQPQLILPGEDSGAFHQLRQSLLDDYAPASAQEEMLVSQIAENYWRLLRARNMETGALAVTLLTQRREMGLPGQPGDDPEAAAHLALAYTKNDHVFSKIGRYETTIERSYYRAVRELNKMQAERRKHGAEIRSVSQPAESEQPAPVPSSQPVSEIRSVPQSVEMAPEPAAGQPETAPPLARQQAFEISEPIARAIRSLPPSEFARLLDEVVNAPLPDPSLKTCKHAL